MYKYQLSEFPFKCFWDEWVFWIADYLLNIGINMNKGKRKEKRIYKV